MAKYTLVFHGYLGDAEAITGRIFDRLTLTYGKDAVFRDIDNIPAGTDFREYINSILAKCDLLIVVIGRRWLGRTRGSRTGRIDEQNDLVRIEVETALRQNLPITGSGEQRANASRGGSSRQHQIAFVSERYKGRCRAGFR